MKYKLPLLDKQGHAVEFEVYGINKITSDIEHVDVESIAHLFRNITKDEIARPAGPVDVLIGYEYAAYHPEKDQKYWSSRITEKSLWKMCWRNSPTT